MLRDWLTVLSSDNQIVRLYYNQDISKETEYDDQVLPVFMVEKLDGTINCINNVFKSRVPAKT